MQEERTVLWEKLLIPKKKKKNCKWNEEEKKEFIEIFIGIEISWPVVKQFLVNNNLTVPISGQKLLTSEHSGSPGVIKPDDKMVLQSRRQVGQLTSLHFAPSAVGLFSSGYNSIAIMVSSVFGRLNVKIGLPYGMFNFLFFRSLSTSSTFFSGSKKSIIWAPRKWVD